MVRPSDIQRHDVSEKRRIGEMTLRENDVAASLSTKIDTFELNIDGKKAAIWAETRKSDFSA